MKVTISCLNVPYLMNHLAPELGAADYYAGQMWVSGGIEMQHCILRPFLDAGI
jgi:hypothetical protein